MGLAVATLPLIVRLEDGTEIPHTLRAEMERPLRKATEGRTGHTPSGLLGYVTKRLAWLLARDLRHGHRTAGHNVPIRGIWIVHEPSNTETWLPATPWRLFAGTAEKD